jgi:CHAT domain-containing protein/tetratricopeptide (TPR) repeat protein
MLHAGSSVDDRVGADPQAAESLAEAGAHHYRLGQYEAAKPLLEKALDAIGARHGVQAPGLLPILNQLARANRQLGELKKAWNCSERALNIAEAAFGSQSAELATPLEGLAKVYFALGFLDKCYRTAERVVTILQAAFGDDHVEVALARDRLGVALAEMGGYERARELHMGALAVLRAHGCEQQLARVLANAAATYLVTGDLEAARPLYEQALATAREAHGDGHEDTAAYLALLGDYWTKAGDDAQALREYREALAVKRAALGELHPDIAYLLFKIGQTEYRQNPSVGREIVFQAIAITNVRMFRPHLFADICAFLARILAPSPAAIFFWKLAVNDIESLRRHVARLDGVLERSFLRRNRDDFRALGEALIAHGRLPEAQHVLTMIKEHELFSVARIEVRKTRVPLTGLEARWFERGLRLLTRTYSSLAGDRNSSLRSDIIRAGKDLNAVLDKIVADFDGSHEKAGRAERHSMNSARVVTIAPGQIPPPGAALLQYLLMPNHCDVGIILTLQGLQREFRLTFAEGEVNQLIYSMRESLQSRSDRFLPSSQRLYDILIAPLAEMLQAAGVETLIVSLDGVLRYLPMGALHDGRRYLIEQFALARETQAVTVQAQKSSGKRAVGLGVSRSLDGHAALIGVRDELAAVIRTARRRRGGVLPGVIRLDRAFTAGALVRALSSQYSVIHVASHFVFAAAREESSYLLLGDGSKLTLAEFADLRFDTMDMVVLSACNTAIGGGHDQNGREIEGLGALVRYQGANQVLATLWPVADITTASLMHAFYRNRYRTKLAPAEALRRAQLDLLRGAIKSPARTPTRALVDPDEDQTAAKSDARHPFYWAPYILMGAFSEKSV